MIEVSINREIFRIAVSGTLAGVLPLLDIRQRDGIAIAVNNTVIPRSDWDRFVLQERDEVFVIRATQGG